MWNPDDVFMMGIKKISQSRQSVVTNLTNFKYKFSLNELF